MLRLTERIALIKVIRKAKKPNTLLFSLCCTQIVSIASMLLSSSICSSCASSSSTFFAALSCMSVVKETVMVDSEGAEGDIWRGQGLMVTVVHEDSEDISGLVLMIKLLTSAKHVNTKSRSC